MWLIEKGKRPRAVCRECKALHSSKDCPRISEIAKVRQAAVRFYQWYKAHELEAERREA